MVQDRSIESDNRSIVQYRFAGVLKTNVIPMMVNTTWFFFSVAVSFIEEEEDETNYKTKTTDGTEENFPGKLQ